MAGKATAFAYSEPFVTKAGGLLFTQTKVEITEATGEYPKGGIAITAEKLGLTDGLIASIWCSPLQEVKFSENKKGGGKAYPAQIQPFNEVSTSPVQLFSEATMTLLQAGKEKEFGLELEEAQGKSLGKYFAYIYAFGK